MVNYILHGPNGYLLDFIAYMKGDRARISQLNKNGKLCHNGIFRETNNTVSDYFHLKTWCNFYL